MNIFKKLFGGSPSTGSEEPTNMQEVYLPDAVDKMPELAQIDLYAITHLILLVDKANPILGIRDMPNFVNHVWCQANPEIGSALASAKMGNTLLLHRDFFGPFPVGRGYEGTTFHEIECSG